jgi:hypothetical protein
VLKWIYTPAADATIEPYRPRARLAVAALPAWFILAIPIMQLVDAVVSGRPLGEDWFFCSVLRSDALVLLFACAIRWILSLLDTSSPRWWRAMWVLGMGFAASSFIVALAFELSPGEFASGARIYESSGLNPQTGPSAASLLQAVHTRIIRQAHSVAAS